MSTIFSLPQSHAVHELFKSIDENADGTINQEEFSKDMKDYVFNKLDNNNNKAISKAEWMGINNPLDAEQHEVLFQEIDKNKDKLITFFEFSDYAERHSNIEEAFIGLDRDGSNSLSPDEITIRPLFRMITIKFK
jgi:hypothetical protein